MMPKGAAKEGRGKSKAQRPREELSAVSSLAAEAAAVEARLVQEHQDRLREERQKKQKLWEEELQRELQFQRQTAMEQRSLAGAKSLKDAGLRGSVYPE